MSTIMRGCHPGQTCRHGPTPAVIYLTERSDDRYALGFLRARGWPHAATIHETDTTTSALEERNGWKRVLALLEDDTAEIVVIRSPAQLGLDRAGFNSLRGEFRQRETVLISVADG